MELPFRIEHKDSFRVVGYLIKTTNQKGEGRKAIPSHWLRIQNEHLEDSLLKLANPGQDSLLGISIYNTDPADSRKFNYLIAVPSDCEVPD